MLWKYDLGMRRRDGMDCQAVVATEAGCPEEKL
jgi:hypothetical protein